MLWMRAACSQGSGTVGFDNPIAPKRPATTGTFTTLAASSQAGFGSPERQSPEAKSEDS